MWPNVPLQLGKMPLFWTESLRQSLRLPSRSSWSPVRLYWLAKVRTRKTLLAKYVSRMEWFSSNWQKRTNFKVYFSSYCLWLIECKSDQECHECKGAVCRMPEELRAKLSCCAVSIQVYFGPVDDSCVYMINVRCRVTASAKAFANRSPQSIQRPCTMAPEEEDQSTFDIAFYSRVKSIDWFLWLTVEWAWTYFSTFHVTIVSYSELIETKTLGLKCGYSW